MILIEKGIIAHQDQDSVMATIDFDVKLPA